MESVQRIPSLVWNYVRFLSWDRLEHCPWLENYYCFVRPIRHLWVENLAICFDIKVHSALKKWRNLHWGINSKWGALRIQNSHIHPESRDDQVLTIRSFHYTPHWFVATPTCWSGMQSWAFCVALRLLFLWSSWSIITPNFSRVLVENPQRSDYLKTLLQYGWNLR